MLREYVITKFLNGKNLTIFQIQGTISVESRGMLIAEAFIFQPAHSQLCASSRTRSLTLAKRRITLESFIQICNLHELINTSNLH